MPWLICHVVVIGEVALLTNSRRTASIRAYTCCELQVLTKEDLMMVFRDYPEYEAVMHEVSHIPICMIYPRHAGLINQYDF
jgi:hypothetical protein